MWGSYCGIPHPDTRLALCPAPPHSWERQKLQVWEETEVGSGKGLLTQYFRVERQRVWRVWASLSLDLNLSILFLIVL